MNKQAMKALQQVRIFFPSEVPKNMDLREYLKGYEAEMEHANVTGGDPVTTARIALVHIDENPRYYSLLEKYVEKKGLSGLGKLSADDMAEFREQMKWEPGGIQEKIFMDRYDVASLKHNKKKFLWVLKHGGVPDRYKDRALSFGKFQMKINDVYEPDSIGSGLTRAMSWEEWQQAKESGYFSSSGDLNVLAPKNVTFFGWMQDTIFYTRTRQVASLNKPNVIIEFSSARTAELVNSGILTQNDQERHYYQSSKPVPATGLIHLIYAFPDKSFSNITSAFGDGPNYYYVDVSDEIPEHMR